MLYFFLLDWEFIEKDRCQSKKFYIQHFNEVVNLFSTISFRIVFEIPNWREFGEGGLEFGDGLTCNAEVSLLFTDEKEKTSKEQKRKVRLIRDNFSTTLDQKYTSIRFDGINFSCIDLLFTFAETGYAFKKKYIPKENETTSKILTKSWGKLFSSSFNLIFSDSSNNKVADVGTKNVSLLENKENMNKSYESSNKEKIASMENIDIILLLLNNQMKFLKFLSENKNLSLIFTNSHDKNQEKNFLDLFLENLVKKKEEFHNLKAIHDGQKIDNSSKSLNLVLEEFCCFLTDLKNYNSNKECDEGGEKSNFQDFFNVKLTKFNGVACLNLLETGQIKFLFPKISKLLLDLTTLIWQTLNNTPTEKGGFLLNSTSIQSFRMLWIAELKNSYLKDFILNEDTSTNTEFCLQHGKYNCNLESSNSSLSVDSKEIVNKVKAKSTSIVEKNESFLSEQNDEDKFSANDFDIVEESAEYTLSNQFQVVKRVTGEAVLKIATNMQDCQIYSKEKNLNSIIKLTSSNIYENLQLSEQLIDAKIEKKRKCVLFVFVHGFMGNSLDFRHFKNQLIYYNLMKKTEEELNEPTFLYLNSKYNEKYTNTLNLNDLGNNLSKEIDDFVLDHCNGFEIEKMNLVCHSLGGLISRAALSTIEMKKYQKKLNLFISLSTPHISLGLSQNFLFDSGLSILQTFQNSPAIEELLLQDQNKTLLKLSSNKVLGNFKKIKFFGSEQDGYTPIKSACLQLEIDSNAELDLRQNEILQDVKEMQTNLLKDFSENTFSFESFEIKFKKYEQSFVHGRGSNSSLQGFVEGLIGRSAHIGFIEDHKLADLLIFFNESDF
ncbi:hypothetical protein HDU92_003891 [Lobulomyces angularis]|nr:hypothetical protein HDU92_003891 [Lobulomyces angularis]